MKTLKPIILASASQSRRSLLSASGVEFDVVVSNVDEDEIKNIAKQDGWTVSKTALALAAAKAEAVQTMHPEAIIIGADQMLELEGNWFDKPSSVEVAKKQLEALRGKTHRLLSGLVLLAPEKERWTHIESADLTMRNFSDTFLDSYIQTVGEEACKSVGGYFLEGLGVQMFDQVRGDYFTILGLPMAPLLNALRLQGALLI
ncbi:MAG: nucleoside triphosphate pyrophosphatase [Rhodospirillales bacterium]